MAGITIVITRDGIFTADGGAAAQALLQRLEGAIASGEAQLLL